MFFIVQLQFDQAILQAHMSPHMNTHLYYYNTIRTSIYKSLLNFSETIDLNVQSHENVVGFLYYTKIVIATFPSLENTRV